MVAQRDDFVDTLVSKHFAPVAPRMQSLPIQQQVAPVAPAEEEEEEEEDKGPDVVDRLFGGIGKVASAAGDVLDASGKYMARPILGALSKGIANENVQGVLSALGSESLSDEEAERIRNADSLTAAWRERAAMDDVSWWEAMIAETIADPTTYITAGGAAALTKVPWIARAANASPEVKRALMQAENIAGQFERLQALPLTAPVAGVKKGLGKVAPNFVAESAESKFKHTIEAGDQALQNFRKRGGSSMASGDAGEIAFSGTEGIKNITGSNIIANAKTNIDNVRMQSIDPTTNAVNGAAARREFWNHNTEDLVGMYNNIDKADPLFPELENVMLNKGFLKRTPQRTRSFNAQKKPTGTTTTWTYSLDQPKIDQSIAAGKRLKSQPGQIGATPATGKTTSETADNVIKFVRHKAGLPSGGQLTPMESYAKKVLTKGMDVNPGRTNMEAIWMNPDTRTDLLKAFTAPTEREANTHLASMFYKVGAKESARGLLHPFGLTKYFDKLLPNIQKTANDVNLPAYNKYGTFNSVIDDEDMKFLEQMASHKEVLADQIKYEKARRELIPIFKNTPGVPALNDATTARAMNDALDKFNPADRAKVEQFLRDYNLHEDTFDDAVNSLSRRITKVPGRREIDTYSIGDAWNDMIIDKWAQRTAAEMGLKTTKPDPNVLGKLGWVPKLWREQALLSIRYHAVNALDMSTKSLIYGVNGVQNRGAKDTARATGLMVLPRSVFVGNERTNMSSVGHLMGNAAEFTGAGEKSYLGPVGRFNRAFARGTENSFREWAWDNGYKDALQRYKPILHQQIRDSFGTANPTRASRADSLIERLETYGTKRRIGGQEVFYARDQGIRFSPQELNELARAHGLSPSEANKLSRLWADATNQASDEGVKMADKVHFDFDKTYNWEDKLLLKKIMPFHFFATRNIPFYMETLANRPELVNAWMAYQDVSEQDRIEMGFPARVSGMVEVGDGFLDTILGPGKIFFNPMSAISFVDQTKNFGTATQEDEFNEPTKLASRRGIGKFLDKSAQIGVGGFAPWVQIPLSIVGLTAEGAEDETMPLLRHSGLAENYLGFDLGEGALRSGINDFRAAFHDGKRVETHTGSQFKDNAIVTRLQENMQTYIDLNRNVPPDTFRKMFTDASKEGPGNALWDAAAEEVRKVQGGNDLRNFWFPFPTKQTTEQGNRLKKAREDMPDAALDSDPIVDLLKHFGDPSVANRGFERPGLVDRYGERIWGDEGGSKKKQEKQKKSAQSTQDASWGGSVWGPEKEGIFGSWLYHQAYVQWRKTADPEHNTPQDYFAAVGVT